MKKTMLILLVLYISISIKNTSYCQSIEDMIPIAEIGDKLLRSGKGKIKYEYTINTNSEEYFRLKNVFEKLTGTPYDGNFILNRIGEYEFIFDNNLFSLTTRAIEDRFEEEKHVYNGEQVNVLKKFSNKKGLKAMSGEINEYQGIEGYVYEFADPRYHYYIYGEPIAKFLLKNPQYIGKQEKNGILCTVFKWNRDSLDNDNSVYDDCVWLGPSEMYYRPIHSEHQIRNSELDKVGKVESDYEYVNESELLIPQRVIVREYHKNSLNKLELFMSRTYTLTQDSIFNIDIPYESFQLTFPEGIQVTDNRIGKVIQSPK